MEFIQEFQFNQAQEQAMDHQLILELILSFLNNKRLF